MHGIKDFVTADNAAVASKNGFLCHANNGLVMIEGKTER